MGTADLYVDGSASRYGQPAIARYFGVSDIFTPSANGTLSIYLKNMTFGMNIVANNFTEGKIRVSMEGAPDIIMDSDGQGKPVYLSMIDMWNAFIMSDYYETYYVMVEWIDPQNNSYPIENKEVSFFCNTIKNITVNVPSGN